MLTFFLLMQINMLCKIISSNTNGSFYHTSAASHLPRIFHSVQQTHPEGGWTTGGESADPGQQPCSWSGRGCCQSLGTLWIREVEMKQLNEATCHELLGSFNHSPFHLLLKIKCWIFFHVSYFTCLQPPPPPPSFYSLTRPAKK